MRVARVVASTSCCGSTVSSAEAPPAVSLRCWYLRIEASIVSSTSSRTTRVAFVWPALVYGNASSVSHIIHHAVLSAQHLCSVL